MSACVECKKFSGELSQCGCYVHLECQLIRIGTMRMFRCSCCRQPVWARHLRLKKRRREDAIEGQFKRIRI